MWKNDSEVDKITLKWFVNTIVTKLSFQVNMNMYYKFLLLYNIAVVLWLIYMNFGRQHQWPINSNCSSPMHDIKKIAAGRHETKVTSTDKSS